MGKAIPPTNEQARFLELLHKFDNAMLVTHTADGHCHARPMAIAHVDDDGVMWFATRLHTAKADEIHSDRRVLVVLQGGARYLSLSGQAQVDRDPARVQQLWSESWRLWFKDKSDPELALIRVTPEEAEFWDQAGARGIKYLLRAASAYVTGHQLAGSEQDPEQHGKVRM